MTPEDFLFNAIIDVTGSAPVADRGRIVVPRELEPVLRDLAKRHHTPYPPSPAATLFGRPMRWDDENGPVRVEPFADTP